MAGKITRIQVIRPKTTMMEETTMNGKGEDLTLASSPRRVKCTQVSRTTKITTESDLIKTFAMIVVRECTMAKEGLVAIMKEAQEIIMMAATITTVTEESMAIHLTSVSGRETVISSGNRTECIIYFIRSNLSH